MAIEFEWDEAKRKANLVKHGIDFLDAIGVFDSVILETEDQRRDYGERRFRALGKIEGEVLDVVYTWRRRRCRTISARKAGSSEKEAYHAGLRRSGEDDDG
jgi:uncharacterized protein